MRRMGRGLRGLKMGWSWGLRVTGVVRVALRVGICSLAGYNRTIVFSSTHLYMHVYCNIPHGYKNDMA